MFALDYPRIFNDLVVDSKNLWRDMEIFLCFSLFLSGLCTWPTYWPDYSWTYCVDIGKAFWLFHIVWLILCSFPPSYDSSSKSSLIFCFVVSALSSAHSVNCSNLGQPDITWDAKKATILQNLQGPYFILPKNIETNVFAFKEIFHNREKRLTRN